MSLISLILSNLKYYRKSYLAILAGTVISTAVLTGALVVGDSVRFSLIQLTDIRLGKTRFAIHSGDRFFRQKLATELADHTKSQVAAVLQLVGIAVNSDKKNQVSNVDVLGVDEHFMKLWNASKNLPGEDKAILSRNTAEKLNLKPGDEFLLKIRKQAKASENAPFVSEKEPLIVFRLKVAAIADDLQMGRFSLKSNQAAPFNIFIPLAALAHKVELEGNANILLIAENKDKNLSSQKLDSLLRICWQPEDAGLEFSRLPAGNSNEIKSERIFIDDNTAKAIHLSIPEAKPVFTYLVNNISANRKSTPYSFVTATDFPDRKLSEHEIIISNWLATDLNVKSGDSVQLRYFKMGALRKLSEDSTRFRVKTILPITHSIFDRTLMPDFPGMSDAGNCREWETGAPVDLNKIRDKDEKYWNDYRGTPKAFISIAAGQNIWNNAFGLATAYRFPGNGSDLQIVKNKLMTQLNPSENGLQFQDVYSDGKSAATNSTDFGGLFLSLSFFIIVAALLLTALLFSLHAQKRMEETAIMAAMGFRKKKIILILFMETLLVVIAGSILGMMAGIFYNKLLLFGLNTLWNDAVRTSMLQVHLVPATLILGFVISVITALLTLLFVLLRNLSKSLSVLVKGVEIPSPGYRHVKASLAIAVLSFCVAVSILVYAFNSSESDLSEVFLSAAGFILVGGIVLLYYIILHSIRKTSDSVPGFFTMILRNISLKRRRTLLSVALLAIGTFSIIITGANRKTYYGTENNAQSGTGGFLFWAESTIPVLYDLNTPEGKKKYGLSDEPLLQNVRFLQMLRLEGNDASCLNLNQVSQPAILGINPDYFDQKQSFGFLKLDPLVNEQHPWSTLSKELTPGIIPGFADQTVIQWGIHKNIGDTLLYRNESGKVLKVKIMGGLDNSIFQGNILISSGLFRQYYPSVGGSRVMLINGTFENRSAISARLEYLFQDYGMVVTAASERLAQFNSVENTYLSVFMMLGGLGIIIGTIGLGIVLLRNLADRKREIALYQAIGFKQSYILKLILTENLFILLAGIGIGIVAAFAGILPSFFSPAFHFSKIFLPGLIVIIFLNGLAWIYFPVKSALRKNLVGALRKE
jgi:ABC-type antimicrobial peptide transport system permease subunit